nr:HD domain-containing protein [Armatimonadota bacterium]
EAFCFANRLHGGQTRKGTKIPYMTHLIGVMALVIDNGGDEEQAMAALLHDAVEDQGGQRTIDEIKRRFGDRVALIVEGCTDTYTEPKPEWLPRKKQYLEHLNGAPVEVRLVSLADKVHNTRAIVSDRNQIGDKVWERFTASREQTLWYYGELLRIFTSFGDCPPLVDALRSAVEELNRV